MKKFIIFVLVCVVGYGAYYFYKENNMKLVAKSQAALVTPNGKYKYEKMSKDFVGYLKKLDGGKFYEEKDKHPKVVLYTNVVDTHCPYRRNFQKKMPKYTTHAGWVRQYTFLKIDVKESEQKFFKTPSEYNEFAEFNNNCSFFCIIDFEKEAFFSGRKNTDDYVYDVLSSFYNT